jgi:hypothetical protein
VEHYGPQNADAVVDALANSSEKDAADKSHAAFRRCRLTLKVPISQLEDGPCKGFSVLKLSHLVHYMASTGELSRLYGGVHADKVHGVLEDWWAKFRRTKPTYYAFQLFEQGIVDPAWCIPVYIHGDEGRGRLETLLN